MKRVLSSRGRPRSRFSRLRRPKSTSGNFGVDFLPVTPRLALRLGDQSVMGIGPRRCDNHVYNAGSNKGPAALAKISRARPLGAFTAVKKELSHFDEHGASRMVDVSQKAVTDRVARASGRVSMAPETLLVIRDKQLAKGDVLEVARLAGIMAAKRT